MAKNTCSVQLTRISTVVRLVYVGQWWYVMCPVGQWWHATGQWWHVMQTVVCEVIHNGGYNRDVS